MLSLIIYTEQDKQFKWNRGFVFGTRVEIWEVSSDKSGPAACKESLAWQSVPQHQSRGCCSSSSPAELASKYLFKYTVQDINTIFTCEFSHNSSQFQLISWRAINQPHREQDANLGGGYTSSQQATDDRKKNPLTSPPKKLLPLGMWD